MATRRQVRKVVGWTVILDEQLDRKAAKELGLLDKTGPEYVYTDKAEATRVRQAITKLATQMRRSKRRA